MVRLFAEINRSASPMLGIIALGVCATALAWIDAGPLVTWITFIACAIAIGYALPIAFLDSSEKEKTAGAWRRKFVLSTTLCGSAWAYLIVALLQSGDPNAQAFAIVVMLLVSTVMSLLAAAIPAAFVAGMLPMIIGVIILYAPRLQGAALPTAALAVGVIGYFLVVARRLHAAAAQNISFQAEKDSLIAELEQAKLNSDEARRRAESANLAKSRFLATMSHELRTPLNAVLGFSEVMKAELFGPHTRASLQGIFHRHPRQRPASPDAHQRNSRPVAGRSRTLRTEGGAGLAHRRGRGMSAVSCRCESNGAHLAITEALERDLPRIWADERAVRQVTLNLLTNAIKFTPQGGSIVIKVGWTRTGGQYLSIRDTGPGIPPEEIPIVLSSFGRGALAQKNAEEGTGLGLPIVKGLVELHGGEFRLNSTLRFGTEVIVIFPPERVMDALPALDPEAAAEPAERRRRRSRRRGAIRRSAA